MTYKEPSAFTITELSSSANALVATGAGNGPRNGGKGGTPSKELIIYRDTPPIVYVDYLRGLVGRERINAFLKIRRLIRSIERKSSNMRSIASAAAAFGAVPPALSGVTVLTLVASSTVPVSPSTLGIFLTSVAFVTAASIISLAANWMADKETNDANDWRDILEAAGMSGEKGRGD